MKFSQRKDKSNAKQRGRANKTKETYRRGWLGKAVWVKEKPADERRKLMMGSWSPRERKGERFQYLTSWKRTNFRERESERERSIRVVSVVNYADG